MVYNPLPRGLRRGRRMPFDPTRGWGGLDDLFRALSDAPMSEMQFERMAAGYTPGGERGRFTGLTSPALQLISKMLQKNSPNLIDTTGLSGDDLFRAELQNSVAKMAPVTYSLHSGVDESFFTDLLDDAPGMFREGFNPTGPRMPFPGPGPRRPKRRRRGRTPPIVPPYHIM